MKRFTVETGKKPLRIPAEVKALLSALRVSAPDAAQLIELSDAQWRNLFSFTDISHLTLPMAQLPSAGFPQWVIDRLRINRANNALRYERVKTTYREAAAALEQAGVEHIVIKGFTQAPDYVPDPRLRAQSDIDIFCPPESLDAARLALQAIGYSPSGGGVRHAFADHKAILERQESWEWRGIQFDPEMPLGIELHFCLWNERVSQIRDPGTALFWGRHTMRTMDDFSFYCLSPVDHLAYLALHILRNIFLGEWIVHHVRELAVFLHDHADDEPFWKSWTETQSPFIRSFAAIAFYHARAWFGCVLHPVCALEIEMLPAAHRSWLHRFSGSALEIMFEKNKDSVWLQLNFISSRKAKWKILRRTLIPPNIESIGSPGVQVRNKRQVPSNGRPLWQRYLAYLISRSATHGRAGIATLWRGLRWHFSQPSALTNRNGKAAGYG